MYIQCTHSGFINNYSETHIAKSVHKKHSNVGKQISAGINETVFEESECNVWLCITVSAVPGGIEYFGGSSERRHCGVVL